MVPVSSVKSVVSSKKMPPPPSVDVAVPRLLEMNVLVAALLAKVRLAECRRRIGVIDVVKMPPPS